MDEKPNLNGGLIKNIYLCNSLVTCSDTRHKPRKKYSPFAPQFFKGLENFLFYLSFSNTCFSTLVVQTQLVFWLHIYCNSSLSKSPPASHRKRMKELQPNPDKGARGQKLHLTSPESTIPVYATDEWLHHMTIIIQRWGFVLWN